MTVRITPNYVQIDNDGGERLTIQNAAHDDEVMIALEEILVWMPKHEFAAFVDELHRRWGGFKQGG